VFAGAKAESRERERERKKETKTTAKTFKFARKIIETCTFSFAGLSFSVLLHLPTSTPDVLPPPT
jgi:hypothetical protein